MNCCILISIETILKETVLFPFLKLNNSRKNAFDDVLGDRTYEVLPSARVFLCRHLGWSRPGVDIRLPELSTFRVAIGSVTGKQRQSIFPATSAVFFEPRRCHTNENNPRVATMSDGVGGEACGVWFSISCCCLFSQCSAALTLWLPTAACTRLRLQTPIVFLIGFCSSHIANNVNSDVAYHLPPEAQILEMPELSLFGGKMLFQVFQKCPPEKKVFEEK